MRGTNFNLLRNNSFIKLISLHVSTPHGISSGVNNCFYYFPYLVQREYSRSHSYALAYYMLNLLFITVVVVILSTCVIKFIKKPMCGHSVVVCHVMVAGLKVGEEISRFLP
jgi:hypothetical protein